MQNLLWKAVLKNGQIVCQEKDGQYFDFTELDKNNLMCFGVTNSNNNSNYTINLITGQFLFNGISLSPSIQYNGFDIDCITGKKLNYSKGLFWYNQLSSQFNAISGISSDVQIHSTFFGYQVFLQLPYTFNNIVGTITLARPMIKIQRNNNKVTFSNQFIFEYKENQKIKKIIL